MKGGINSGNNNYLTGEQARYIYRKVESGNIIDVNTLEQENEQEQQLSRIDDSSGDVNPYREMIVNNSGKEETVLSQMKQWLILSNVINHIQCDKHPKNFHSLSISTVNKEKNKQKLCRREEKEHLLEFDFGDTADKLKEEYLDVYDGIQSEILSTMRFDENSDLSTTYLW